MLCLKPKSLSLCNMFLSVRERKQLSETNNFSILMFMYTCIRMAHIVLKTQNSDLVDLKFTFFFPISSYHVRFEHIYKIVL